MKMVLGIAPWLWLSGSRAETAPPPPATLEHCAAIGAAVDRLACYDKAMGRAPAPEAPPGYVDQGANGSGGGSGSSGVGVANPPLASASASASASGSGSAPAPALASSSLLAPKNALPTDPDARSEPPSLLSKFWELSPQDKRGVFNFVGYRNNYVLPLHVTNRINRSPYSPSQPAVNLPNYRKEEAKFQFSARTKIAQDLLLPDADLWVAYTQQATWQIWNGRDSKPFRNSDYEPEMMYIVPTAAHWRELPLGWQWRYTQLGIAHQSNGQSDPLSRSWNRLNLAAGFERGDWSLTTRLLHRLSEPAASDNNPDLVSYRGRGEFQLNWAHERHTLSLTYRTTLKDVKYGALQLEWTYPVFRDQPNGLRWYVQAFNGYGETLTDYNFRQTSFGVGVSFLQF
ncbi:MAG: phospholipase A [Burkholderiaceae bacterium]